MTEVEFIRLLKAAAHQHLVNRRAANGYDLDQTTI
jgi:hypothetical protein